MYREYIFKSRGSYEILVEITKNLVLSTAQHVARIVPMACNAPQNSLLFNAFGVLTFGGELQIYNFNKLNLQIEQKIRCF